MSYLHVTDPEIYQELESLKARVKDLEAYVEYLEGRIDELRVGA